MIVDITDPADPRIGAYKALRDRDVTGRDGGFIAEGEVVLRAWLRSGRHQLISLLLAEKRVAKLAPLIAQLPHGVTVYRAEQPILDAIAGFHLHRGVLALGRRAAAVSADALLAGLTERALVVALFGLSNHDNVGGVFRNAAAFGADAVLLDETCCNPLYRKAIRVSVGAALTVPFARLAKGEDCLSLFAQHGLTAYALSPAGTTALRDAEVAPRSVIMFGAEGPGLPPRLIAATRSLQLDMAGGFNSLNVATTSGIVLHHFVR